MGYTLVSAPAAEPLLLADVKTHLKVDTTADDTLITALIVAARQFAEQLTKRSFINQTWRYTCDGFPRGRDDYGEFRLIKGPVTAISSIVYLDTNSVSQTLATSEYTSDLTGPLARVAPQFGKVWPPSLPQIGAVQVNFTAGYGASGTSVPDGIKQWMLLRIGALYEHRQEITDGELKPLPFVDSLLDPWRIEVA